MQSRTCLCLQRSYRGDVDSNIESITNESRSEVFAIKNVYYYNYNKLLKTSNTDIVKYSQDQFGFKLPSELIPNRTAKFIAKLQASDCV